MPATLARLIYIACALGSAQLAAQQLKVTTSADADSNAARSFIMVQANQAIPHGIKHDAPSATLATQIPFIAELEPVSANNIMVQWQVTIPSKNYGEIEVISKFNGNTSREKNIIVWRSQPLASTVPDRHKLIFRPAAPVHLPVIYRKGLGTNGERHKYGGGTRLTDDSVFNPRLTYQIHVDLLQDARVIESYKATISMDDKDLIRQEYINHYGIKRYGFGGDGNLPVPRRDELTPTPDKPANILGNPLTESAYGLLVNDGMLDLVQRVADIYTQQQAYYREHPLLDLNKKALPVPQSKLWLSGGWRNPERNEWFSNAANGIHQRGGAVDIIANEPPGDANTAVVYWMLWNGLQQNKNNFNAYWQLETRGRPMRTKEFIEDIEPVNGIPDAFDKADHLHINIPYNTTVEE
jgi:hypothetical protein